MRTFDYRHLPSDLFSGKVGDANVRVYEDRGKLDVLKKMQPDALEALRVRTHAENVDASTRIEGLYVDFARVNKLIGGDEPLDETEQQIVGYSKALSLVEEGMADKGLSTSAVLELYETLYGYRNLGRKSRYRKKDYAYVQVDGHVQALPVSPITAFETPLVLGGACDSMVEAFSADACSPLVLGAVFTVDFLCIRPFDEGNGRIARLFSNLMLAKAGFDVFRYQSVERIVEESGMAYYDALNACVEGWERGRNDYAPYVLYWLEVLHEAHKRLFDRLEAGGWERAGKSQRVAEFVRRADVAVSKRQVREALPDVSEATVEAALGKLVKEGLAEKVGAGRSTAYRWL